MAITTIMALRVNNRRVKAQAIQNVLTEYGCVVKVRLGLHETADECSDEGLIMIQLQGGKDEHKVMEEALNNIEGLKAVSMEI